MFSRINNIRIGTRASKLALIQLEEVTSLINKSFPHINCEIIKITTSGDVVKDKSLADIGGKGLFIKELEEAIINNNIDVAIHSAKDVAPIIHPDTKIIAYSKRSQIEDCLVSNKYKSLAAMPNNAIIGTCSPRRKALILKDYPHLNVVSLRGNIDSRLLKVANNEIDGCILALCGINRINKQEIVTEIFNIADFLPSGGQGALAIQARCDNKLIIDLFQKINHRPTAVCLVAERSFLTNFKASCITPVAVYCQIVNDKIILEYAIYDYDGKNYYRNKIISDLGNHNLLQENDYNKIIEIAKEIGINAVEDVHNNAKDLVLRIIN